MAEIVLTDCHITIDSVDYSGKNTDVAISYSAEALDATAMGADTRKHIGGIKDWSMAMEFLADESVTGSFFDMVGTVVPVQVRASSGAIAETNPSYEGDALVTEYTPLGGAYGELSKVSLSLISASDLARNVSAV